MLQNVLLLSTIMLLGIVFFETLARRTRISAPLIRKSIHVGMGVAIVIVTLWIDYHAFVAVGLLFAVLFLLARKTFGLKSVRDRQTNSWGEIMFPLGVAATAAIASSYQVFAVSIAVLAFADTAAYIIGNRYKNSKKILPHRNVAGSGAAAIVTAVILAVSGFSFSVILATTIVVSLCEIITTKGLDNLAMPVAAATTITIISQVIS